MSLYSPTPVEVGVGADDAPASVGSRPVVAVRESWVVEESWWTRRPLRRHYWELVLADGSDVVVFRERDSGRWYRQRD